MPLVITFFHFTPFDLVIYFSPELISTRVNDASYVPEPRFSALFDSGAVSLNLRILPSTSEVQKWKIPPLP